MSAPQESFLKLPGNDYWSSELRSINEEKDGNTTNSSDMSSPATITRVPNSRRN